MSEEEVLEDNINKSSNISPQATSLQPSPRTDYRQFYAYKQANREEVKTDIGIILTMLRYIRDKKREKLKKTSIDEFHNDMDELEATILKQMSKYVELDNRVTELERENAKLRGELDGIEMVKNEIKQIGKPTSIPTPVTKQQEEMNRDLYSIIIENIEDNGENVRELVRKEMRTEGKKINLKDVATTRNNKLIFKAEKKEELDELQKWISENKTFENKIKCSKPSRKTERIMLLGLAPDTETETIKDTLICQVSGKNPNIVPYKPLRRRDGLLNWMVDVDCESRKELLNQQRCCIDRMRVKIVEYIRLWRCFNCQGLGHTSTYCKNKTKCGKCSQEHKTNDCTSEFEKCANCQENTDHRSDSYSCPTFTKYKIARIAKRL